MSITQPYKTSKDYRATEILNNLVCIVDIYDNRQKKNIYITYHTPK